MPMSQEPAGADPVPAGCHVALEGGGHQLQTAAGKRHKSDFGKIL